MTEDTKAGPRGSRRKLLVVSHACVTPVNQLLFCELTSVDPELDITLLVPANWRNEYTGRPWIVEAHSRFLGRIVTLPVWLTGHISLHAYRHGIRSLLNAERPDWIYLDEEPWALVSQQVSLMNRHTVGASVLFHTNQNLNKTYPPPFRWFEQRIYRQAAHALPVGEEAAQVLRQKGYRGPLEVFPYGIDETLYQPDPDAAVLRARLGATEGSLVFGYLGRFVEEKGIDVLLDAFLRIKDRHPSACLWLVGDGPHRAALEHLARENGLASPRCRILDSIPHLESPRYLSAMDVCVLPSRTRRNWKEQFGRVIVEAIACGTPVIGSDSGEIPHLVRKLGGGLIVPEGDPEALAGAMTELLAHPARLRQLAEAGRRQVLAGYTNVALATRFVEILRGMRYAPRADRV
jgi:glycosyltransferase involved in cell wall biosynthesis